MVDYSYQYQKNSDRETTPSKTQYDGLENIITPHNTLSEHHIQHYFFGNVSVIDHSNYT